MSASTSPRKFPRRGEVYFVDWNPARGSEQAGKRPSLIVSNDVANQWSSVVLVVAITKTIPEKAYPQNVALPAGVLPVAGIILCSQIMTVDKKRLGNHLGDLDDAIMKNLDLALTKALGIRASS